MTVKGPVQRRTQIKAIGDSIIVRCRKWLYVARIHQVTVSRDIHTQAGDTATEIIRLADYSLEHSTADEHFLFQTLFVITSENLRTF